MKVYNTNEKGYDFIKLWETWSEKRGWDRIKKKLPFSHKWESIHAIRVNKKDGRVVF